MPAVSPDLAWSNMAVITRPSHGHHTAITRPSHGHHTAVTRAGTRRAHGGHTASTGGHTASALSPVLAVLAVLASGGRRRPLPCA